MARLTIRVDFGNGAALGPGKVRLLELIAETGSIRKAATGMKMSYRQAWLLLKSLSETFGEALVTTATGGKAGGGAILTPSGRAVIGAYRGLEAAATKASGRHLAVLTGHLATPPARTLRKKPIRKPA